MAQLIDGVPAGNVGKQPGVDTRRGSRSMTVFSVVVPVLALVALVYIAVRSDTPWMWGFLAFSLVLLAIRLAWSRRRRSRAEHLSR